MGQVVSAAAAGWFMTAAAMGLLVVVVVRREHRWWPLVAGVASALLLRLPGIAAGLPYLAYVDEGHVVHRSVYLLSHTTPDPGWYRYGTFLAEATAGVAGLWSLVPGSGPVTVEDALVKPLIYDLPLPPATVVSGRIVVLVMSLLLVAAVGWAARSLAGPVAGAAAVVIAAILPALVTRSQIVIVHQPGAAAVAVVAAATWAMVGGERRTRAAALAGAAAGVAFTSMYVAGAVVILIVAVALASHDAWRDRLTRLSIAGISAVGATLVTMPAWLTSPDAVWRDIQIQTAIYADRATEARYADVVTRADEFGPVVVGMAIVGVVVLLRRDDARVWTLGVLATIGVTLGFLLQFEFQPSQTMLIMAPFAAVFAAVSVGAGVSAITARRGQSSRAESAWAIGVLVPMVAVALWPGHLAERAAEQLSAPRDNRVVGVDRVAAVATPDEITVVVEELFLQPSELARIPGEVRVISLDDLSAAAADPDVDQFLIPEDVAAPSGRLVASIHGRDLPRERVFWRTNTLGLVVIER